MGEMAALLCVPFVVFIGYIVADTGQYIYNVCSELEEDGPWEDQDWICYDVDDWNVHMHKVYIYAGGIASLLFWGCAISVWPFYHNNRPRPEDLERITLNLRNTLTPDPELDLEGQQQQPPPVYGSVQLNESYQGSFSNTSHRSETEEQLLQQVHDHHDVDEQRQHNYGQYQHREDQQQYQEDQYQENQYQEDQYQENQYQEEQYQENQYQVNQYHENQYQGGDPPHENQDLDNQHQDITHDTQVLLEAENAR